MSEQGLTHTSLMERITRGLTVSTAHSSEGTSCVTLVTDWGIYVSDVGDRLVIDLKRPGSNSWYVFCSIAKIGDLQEAGLVAAIRKQIGVVA